MDFRLRALTSCFLCGLLTLLTFFGSNSAAAPQTKEDAPSPPPKGAIVIFNGQDVNNWSTRRGETAKWKVENGYMEVGRGDIMTRDKFGPDFSLHVEFWLPLMADKKGQARSNSGVFLQGRYEIQVLDSYMNDTYPDGACGALYKIIAPSKNACKPPEQWQTYDITLISPRVDDKGKVVQKGVLTVIQNGQTIIDKGEFDKVTGAALDEKMGESGPILLQDHGCKVRYRNLWLLPLSK